MSTRPSATHGLLRPVGVLSLAFYLLAGIFAQTPSATSSQKAQAEKTRREHGIFRAKLKRLTSFRREFPQAKGKSEG